MACPWFEAAARGARQAEDEYMISDTEVFVNKYISVPRDMGQLNCAAFIAGIVKGVLDGAGFPARYACSLAAAIVAVAVPSLQGSLQWCHCALVLPEVYYLLCRVTAHFVPVKGMAKPKTTILMKFEPSVLSREGRMPV